MRPFTLMLMATALAAVCTGSRAESRELPLLPTAGGARFSPDRLSVDSGGELFVLDRAHAQLYRFSPRDGREMWRVDGTEGGEAFIDPVYVSRGDGFFVYLTDRGSRKVWKIDYRGEIRGSLDLPFANDPTFFDLAAGHQLVLYDRASGLVHLLDDTGHDLWSFQPGGSASAGEPVDFALSPDGARLYVLWPGRRMSVDDLTGRTASDPIKIPALGYDPLRLAVLGDRFGFFYLLGPQGRSFMYWDMQSGFPTDSLGRDLIDIRSDGKMLFRLADNPPRLFISEQKERKN